MPIKLHEKLKDDNFITWAQYSNIVGIVISALMIATAFYGVKTELAVQAQLMKSHLEYSQQQDIRFTKMVDLINEQQSRIIRLETITSK